MVGGGFIGLEVAACHRGLEVALVELQPQVLPLLDTELAEPLHRALESHGVQLELGRGIAEIEEQNGLATAVLLTDGTRLPADIVLLGLGVRPNVKLAVDAGLPIGASGGIATDDFMRTSDADIYAVGDAAQVCLSTHRRAPTRPTRRACELHGAPCRRTRCDRCVAPGPVARGTSIVRVFEQTAGITGLSLRAALKAGLDAHAVHITANHHAGYFPGAEEMLLKLVYENGTGRVLGAQAVGGAGIDKRLDIIATVTHFQGTVHDLAQLDLAYAPPFGSAKDPVHMAAFTAENQLDGLVRVVRPGRRPGRVPGCGRARRH